MVFFSQRTVVSEKEEETGTEWVKGGGKTFLWVICRVGVGGWQSIKVLSES